MNLGKIDYAAGTWILDPVAPHVAIRLKHVFQGIRGGSRPPFILKDTPDRAYDLKWFCQRYPLDLTERAKNAMGAGVSAWEKKRGDVEALRAPGYTPPEIGGFKDGLSAHGYQRRAADLWRKTGRLLLLDDVGLGKTVTALAALADGWGLPAAIVVQPHLSGQWITGYINRFTNLRAVEVKDRTPRTMPPADVYVFRYSNIAAWADYAETLACQSVVFDEIQELRHGRATDKGRGAHAFASVAKNVIGLTATPIYNYGSEIFCVVELIAPGALGTWDEFTANWCTTHGTHWIVQDPEALGAYLDAEGITIRRTCDSEDVAITLPSQFKHVFEVEWNDDDAETDRDLQLRLAQTVVSGSFHQRGQAARELDLLLRRETGIAKARSVAAYVRMLAESGERVLLGGWHRDVYAIWNKALADLNPVMFTGSESAAGKRRATDAFCGGEARVMMMSLRSGAGLDGLQHHASQVVFGEFDWSPQVHVQFTGRLARQGQTREVTSHYPYVEGGSDPVIMATLGLKASQSHGLLNPYGGGSEAVPVNATRMRELALKVLETKDGPR